MQSSDLISIIIATKDRESILIETINHALIAIKNFNVEIIVVNDSEKPFSIRENSFTGIKFFNNPRKGVSSARNFGVSISNGNVLFFLDDDMWINKEAIEWILSIFCIESNRKAVYNLDWIYPEELLHKMSSNKVGQYLLSTKYHCMWGRMQIEESQPDKGLYKFNMVMSGSLVMSKEIYLKIGGYNESMIFQGEDNDLANKINELEIPIYCVFDVLLFHNQSDRLEINSFLKRMDDGYASQFKAIHEGLVKPWGRKVYGKGIRQVYKFFAITEWLWRGILFLLPTSLGFKKINNLLIGKLSGLQRFKNWDNYYQKSK